MKFIRYTSVLALFLVACNSSQSDADASGTFEATETLISAQANGRIEALHVEEGQTLSIGQAIGYIDSTQLYLQKKELQAQIQAILSKQPDIAVQLSALETQLRQAKRDQQRMQNLFAGNAATRQQLENANTQVQVIQNKIKAENTSLSTTSQSLQAETDPLQVKIRQLDDQLEKCRILNPVKGTVLTKYAETQENTSIGQPLYKIADLDTLTLRAYVTGTQLPHIKINQEVTVRIDDTKKTYKNYKGRLEWISNKAEFTPKTIQTKEERANLVYAVKIRVKNDGFLKIGMYGEVKF